MAFENIVSYRLAIFAPSPIYPSSLSNSRSPVPNLSTPSQIRAGSRGRARWFVPHWHHSVSLPRSSVGSGTGAPVVGSGGCSIAFALGLSPAPVTTFPAPASSNAACGFPALRFPVAFLPGFMWPIDWGALSAADSGPGIQRTVRAARKATAYSTSSSQIPDARAVASDVAVSSSRPNL